MDKVQNPVPALVWLTCFLITLLPRSDHSEEDCVHYLLISCFLSLLDKNDSFRLQGQAEV